MSYEVIFGSSESQVWLRTLALPLLPWLDPVPAVSTPIPHGFGGRSRRKDIVGNNSGSAVLSVCSGWRLWRDKWGFWLWNKQPRCCVQAIRLGLFLLAGASLSLSVRMRVCMQGMEGRQGRNKGVCSSPSRTFSSSLFPVKVQLQTHPSPVSQY